MEQRNNLVLHGTETFSRGALDNVALESGAVVLDSSAGRYLPYGSYTTPEFAMPAFCNLNVSWNASAPHNTMVEVRCRVYAGNTWTGWLSFGKWAPDYPRCSIKAQSEDGLVFLMGDTVTVATPGGGTGIQLQVNLSTNDLATAFSVVRATALVPDFATALVERVRFTGFLAAAAFAASISALVRRLALALPLRNMILLSVTAASMLYALYRYGKIYFAMIKEYNESLKKTADIKNK